MTFRKTSDKPGWSDWELASEAAAQLRFARLAHDPPAAVERLLQAHFTEEELHRADVFLAVSRQDTDRLTAIEKRLGAAVGGDVWLVDQLRKAWARLDRLRDRIDTGGTLMPNSWVAEAIDYARWSRML